MRSSAKGMFIKIFPTMLFSTMLLTVTTISMKPAFATAVVAPSHSDAQEGKSAGPVSKMKKLPGKVARMAHLKKAKKNKVVDARLNSSDAAGTVNTSVSGIKLKQIPASTEKAQEVSVAQ